jgi:translation initiation factor IF-3
VPTIRCIDSNGDMVGVIPTKEAMKLAHQRGLDLVEISPNADPPVCRIMDFGKFRYDESIKRKKARKQSHTHSRSVKEIKFHANVAEHDYHFKVGHIRSFLQKGHKVKVSLQFRGRENAHRELGFEVVKRVIKDCETDSTVEMEPKMVGRMIVSMLGPRAAKT